MLRDLKHNVYHPYDGLPRLLKLLNDYVNDDIEETKVNEEFCECLDDFYNSYAYDKILLKNVIDESTTISTIPDLINKLVLLKKYYLYYDSRVILENYIKYLKNIKEFKTNKVLKASREVLDYNVFNNLKVDDIYNFLETYDEDETYKKLYKIYLEEGKKTEISFYIISKIVNKLEYLTENYINYKINFYTQYNKKQYCFDILLSEDEMKRTLKFDEELINYSNVFISTFNRFKKYDSNLYNRLDIYEKTKNNIQKLIEISYFISYTDSIEFNTIIALRDKENIEVGNNKLQAYKNVIDNNISILNDIKNVIKNENIISEDQEIRINESYKELSLAINNSNKISENIKISYKDLQSRLNLLGIKFKKPMLITFGVIKGIEDFNVSINHKMSDMHSFLKDIENMINDLSSSFLSLKDVLSFLMSIIDSIGSIRKSIISLLNFLLYPLETLLISINSIICAIKSLICLIVSIIKAIEEATETFIKILNDIFNRNNAEKILNDVLNNLNINFQNLLNEQYKSNILAYQKFLVDNLYMKVFHKLGEQKANEFKKVVNEVFEMCFFNDSIDDIIKQEANNVFNHFKHDVENTFNNILNLLNFNNCEIFNFNDFNINFDYNLDFNLLDLSLELPYLDSSFMKC